MGDLRWLTSHNEYQEYFAQSETLRLYKARLTDLLMQGWRRKKSLPGFSITAGRMVDFHIDTRLQLPGGGINLRETVNCPDWGFNMRMRAAIHAVQSFEDKTAGPVYLCEQKTPMYQYFKERFAELQVD